MNESHVPCASDEGIKRGKITIWQVAFAALTSGLLLLIQSSAGAAESAASIIEETYDSWGQATNDKDIASWSSYLAPSAFFVPPGVPPLATKEDILDYYRTAFADPNFALDCQQLAIEIAKSAEMAWSRGTCYATFTNSNGQRENGKSRWFKVWLKQSDGLWKCKVNTWNYEDVKGTSPESEE